MRSSIIRGAFVCLAAAIGSVPVALAQTGMTAAQRRGTEELLTLHKADRAAHFGHDIQAILDQLGSDVLDIRDGKIARLTRDAVRQHFAEYFASATFTAWDDLEPPIVRVSPDGQMGWMAVRVRIRYTDPAGKAPPADQIEAWTSQYQKTGDRWQLVAVTTTDQR